MHAAVGNHETSRAIRQILDVMQIQSKGVFKAVVERICAEQLIDPRRNAGRYGRVRECAITQSSKFMTTAAQTS
jgi:hypothetical protein